MKRRDFITLFGGAATWPIAARAQQPDRMRRIGVLMGYAESDREGQANVAAFQGGLQKLGWTEGRNIRIDCLCSMPPLCRRSRRRGAYRDACSIARSEARTIGRVFDTPPRAPQRLVWGA